MSSLEHVVRLGMVCWLVRSGAGSSSPRAVHADVAAPLAVATNLTPLEPAAGSWSTSSVTIAVPQGCLPSTTSLNNHECAISPPLGAARAGGARGEEEAAGREGPAGRAVSGALGGREGRMAAVGKRWARPMDTGSG